MRSAVYGACAVLAMAACCDTPAKAGPVTQTVYFTTFNGGGQDVWKTTASYTGNGTAGNGTFTPGTAINLASTPGADGIVLNPNNGQLLVGGQATGNIYQVPTAGGSYTTLNAGMSTYEITVDPSGNSVWGGGSEGSATTITSVPLNPTGGTPTVKPVSGSNTTITHITFVPGQAPGIAFYTSGGDSGGGNFGTIDLSTGVTTALLTGVQYAHGMIYDPFTGDLIISGGNELAQINPTTDALVSLLTLSGDPTEELDQGAVDGQGHLYLGRQQWTPAVCGLQHHQPDRLRVELCLEQLLHEPARRSGPAGRRGRHQQPAGAGVARPARRRAGRSGSGAPQAPLIGAPRLTPPPIDAEGGSGAPRQRVTTAQRQGRPLAGRTAMRAPRQHRSAARPRPAARRVRSAGRPCR